MCEGMRHAAFAATLALATRIWLFAPAVPAIPDHDVTGRSMAAIGRLAQLLRQDPKRVTLVDNPDEADVLVEVGAAHHVEYVKKDQKDIETVTLTVIQGTTRTKFEGSALRAKDAAARAEQQLLAWLGSR
jgi:hypothetical protein